MKFLLVLAFCFFSSFFTFANSSGDDEWPSRPDIDEKVLSLLDASDFRKVSTEQEIKSLSKALTVANDGDPIYGICRVKLYWPVGFSEVRVYVSESSVDPLIVYISENQWMKISVDAGQKSITKVTFGRYEWKGVNDGTITNPIYNKGPKITESKNADDADDCLLEK